MNFGIRSEFTPKTKTKFGRTLPPTDKYVDGRYRSTTVYRSLPMLNRGKRHTTTSQRTAHTFSTNTEERQLSCITAYN